MGEDSSTFLLRDSDDLSSRTLATIASYQMYCGDVLLYAAGVIGTLYLLLWKRVSYKSDYSALRFFFANSASLRDACLSQIVQFEYVVWLPLRVFEQRATIGRVASAASALNNYFLRSSLSLHTMWCPLRGVRKRRGGGCSKVHGGPCGCSKFRSHGSLARLRTWG